MSNSYKEDLDGDGKDENIELIYERGKSEELKGSLMLSINGTKSVVMEDEWFTMPYYLIGQMPKIEFLQEQNGKSKVLLVIYSWVTNGSVGSTGEIRAYKYVNGHISDVEIKNVERIIKYKGDNIVNVHFPSFERNIDFRGNPEKIKMFLERENISEQQLETIDTYDSHPLWYLVKDFNGDGQEELCCVSDPYIPMMDMCKEYTYYKYEQGELKPVQVYVIPLYYDNDKKFDLIISVVR